MDPISLTIFLTVAEEKSVTRAARRLGRVPSNVTTRLQQLETDLGCALFSRDGKKMALTSQGETFLAYAKRLTALAAEARMALRDDGLSEILKVGTMESTAASRLPPVLARFGQAWPNVSLRLSLGATQELVKAVLCGDLDCALVARPPDQPDWLDTFGVREPSLRTTPVYREELLLVLPANHPPVRDANDIAPAALAALEPGCTYRRTAERWIRSSADMQTVEVASYHSILAHVVTGEAVGVMPRSVLDTLKWSSDVAVHPLGIVDTVLISKSNTRSDPLDGFEELLFAAEASHSQTGLPC